MPPDQIACAIWDGPSGTGYPFQTNETKPKPKNNTNTNKITKHTQNNKQQHKSKQRSSSARQWVFRVATMAAQLSTTPRGWAISPCLRAHRNGSFPSCARTLPSCMGTCGPRGTWRQERPVDRIDVGRRRDAKNGVMADSRQPMMGLVAVTSRNV